MEGGHQSITSDALMQLLVCQSKYATWGKWERRCGGGARERRKWSDVWGVRTRLCATITRMLLWWSDAVFNTLYVMPRGLNGHHLHIYAFIRAFCWLASEGISQGLKIDHTELVHYNKIVNKQVALKRDLIWVTLMSTSAGDRRSIIEGMTKRSSFNVRRKLDKKAKVTW